MDSLREISARYPTDKAGFFNYLDNYERWFAQLRERKLAILELGIRDGGSLLMWRDYFPNACISGLDIQPVTVDDPSGRIHVYIGGQQDRELLDRIAAETAPEGFDIIIDDCSHIASLSRISFRHLFQNHLKVGGSYVVEDWGCGYWDTWPDGLRYRKVNFGDAPSTRERIGYRLASYLRGAKGGIGSAILSTSKRIVAGNLSASHSAGMVGFVKELIDDCAQEDIYHPEFGQPGEGSSPIEEIIVRRSHLRIIKK